MACRFTVNSAIQARLLQPSRHVQLCAVSFRTIYEPSRPNYGQLRFPLILNARSYSESTPTPHPPKDSRSTKGSESPRSEDKNWLPPRAWIVTALVGTGLGVIVYITQEFWKDWYKENQRRAHESARESAVYNKLKTGPKFSEEIDIIIPRDALVDQVRMLITPSASSRFYPLIIGEHGTGKTSLIQLATNSLKEPKGVVYVNVPIEDELPIDFTRAMQQALGWKLDPVIDSGKPLSFREVLEAFFYAAVKYKHEYKRIPVLIIDNANRLVEKQLGLLEQIQDYAKLAADEGTATIVFVSSEGRVPRRMIERSSWSRHGRILEIGDISKEEALQYLKLRKVDDGQAVQIYELVGGRMVHLKWAADEIQGKRTLQDVRKNMFYDAENQFKIAGMLPHGRYYKEGAMIIHKLLEKGSISYADYSHLVDPEIGDELLEKNVFALHFDSGKITFQSTVIARFCEQKSVYWKKM